MSGKPVGYHIREDVDCCANCLSGYTGEQPAVVELDNYKIQFPAQSRVWLCIGVILGETNNREAVDPLGVCDNYIPLCALKRKQEEA